MFSSKCSSGCAECTFAEIVQLKVQKSLQNSVFSANNFFPKFCQIYIILSFNFDECRNSLFSKTSWFSFVISILVDSFHIDEEFSRSNHQSFHLRLSLDRPQLLKNCQKLQISVFKLMICRNYNFEILHEGFNREFST